MALGSRTRLIWALFSCTVLAYGARADAQTAPAKGSGGAGKSDAASDPGPTRGNEASERRRETGASARPKPPSDGSMAPTIVEIYSDDWWTRARPVFDLHGYFRTRAELFHNFALGRHDPRVGDTANLWSQPLDNSYTEKTGTARNVNVCGTGASEACMTKTQTTANMRFRLDADLHISDNLRIRTQVDALDNLVLGSTPDAYAMRPSGTGRSGYTSYGVNGYAPLGILSNTQGPPTAGVNSWQNSIAVKRAWAEYESPIGMFRFGRMPRHWGLGMVWNAGRDIDADYQTNEDSIQYIGGLRSLNLTFGASWDFITTGPTSAGPFDVYGGQPYSIANQVNADAFTLFVARRTPDAEARAALAKGNFVIDGGAVFRYRTQYLDVLHNTSAQTTPITTDPTATNSGLEQRSAWTVTPDLWFKLQFWKIRFELEAAAIFGEIGNSKIRQDVSDPVKIRSYGVATQTEARFMDDRLRTRFDFGWASGDPWVASLNPGQDGMQRPLNDRGPLSTFRFHPNYRVDMIFFRHILSRVEGAYYFKLGAEYDFSRNQNGQKFGGGVSAIWSRASEFVQTPGHKRDLGIELNGQLYFQSKDGSLNDDPGQLGGFFAMIQYGVFFPMGGLGYMPGETSNTTVITDWSTSSAAQAARLFLGVKF